MEIKVNIDKLVYELWDKNRKLGESSSAKDLYEVAMIVQGMYNTADMYNNKLKKVVII